MSNSPFEMGKVVLVIFIVWEAVVSTQSTGSMKFLSFAAVGRGRSSLGLHKNSWLESRLFPIISPDRMLIDIFTSLCSLQDHITESLVIVGMRSSLLIIFTACRSHIQSEVVASMIDRKIEDSCTM
eukprot:TRINITY_DN3901_c0_g1_i5.p2 TRINITY_DN3901_c0_g1~~TRINITY_DN3901_c0_g1_i5.p2  ORF type:complete len:126 (+),score=17.38 TRINITY_DN3901_c0_g1_i5:404-781(+)